MKQKKSVATIIIPCYNCEKYLGRCLDSVILQEGAEDGRVEIVVVDDGSTDRSLEVARAYAQHVAFLRIIEQPNKGAAAARNAGMDAASGQYVLFLDADDWLEKDAASLLLQAAEDTGAQVIHYLLQHERLGQTTVAENGIQSKTLMDKEMIRTQAIPMILECGRINSSCLNFYNVSFLREKGIRFEEGRLIAEDARFVWQVLNQAESMYFISRPLYHYFYHTSSTVRNITPKHIQDALGFQKYLQGILPQIGLDTPQNRKLCRRGLIVVAMDLVPKVNDKKLMLELLGDRSLWEAWSEDGYRPNGALACFVAQNACEGKIKEAYWAMKAYAWQRRWLRVWGKDIFLRVKNTVLYHFDDVKRSLQKWNTQRSSN
ncbi:glycosyltransferase [[Clostridium] leptum]|nr:glycosyltransferase [[Clostridium] leptum]